MRAAPAGLAATAQGYLAVAQGLAMTAATGLSGMLYGRYGTIAYGTMALAAAAGGLFALAAHRLSGRPNTSRRVRVPQDISSAG